MIPFPVIVLCVALVQAMLAYMIGLLRPKKSVAIVDKNTIFVGCVSFRSSTILQFVVDIMDKATFPGRLHVGVLEYIGHPEETIVEHIPARMRNNIKVHTLAITQADNVAGARRIVFSELYQYERICMFVNEINITRGWDELVARHYAEGSVLNIVVGNQPCAYFPIVRCIYGTTLSLAKRQFHTVLSEAIPIVVCLEDVIVCNPELVHAVLRYDTVEMRSATLFHANLAVITCTQPFATKAVRVNSLPSTKTDEDREIIRAWIQQLDPIKAKNGLTNHISASEGIAKYGSVAACRLAITIGADHA